jgi:hypothetical protein
MRTKSEGDPQQTAQCVYSIPCECGRSYIGETGRPLAVRLRELRHNLKYDLLEESKLAQHAYKECHRIVRDETRILDSESNSRHKKYNELAHTACLKNSISQPRLDISSSGLGSHSANVNPLFLVPLFSSQLFYLGVMDLIVV